MSIIAEALREVAPLAAPDSPAPKLRRGRRSLRPCPLPDQPETPIPIEAVPALIDSVVSAYLADPSPGHALLLALPAGSGKTTAMVRIAETVAAGGQRVMYAGPRHDFMSDILAISQRPGWWYEWQPRRLADEAHEATCRYAPQMAAWLTRGYPAIEFCKNPRCCGFDYLSKQCPFAAQQRVTHPIIYAQHAHVALRHPLMEQCHLLIGDESPLSTFLSPWIIPPGSIVTRDPPEDIEQLLYTLQMLCHTPPRRGDDGRVIPWSGTTLMEEIGGADHIANLCTRHAVLDIPDAPDLRGPDEVESLDYRYLPALLSMLQVEARAAQDGRPDWVRRVRCERAGLVLLMRRKPGPLPNHIIWLDATGDEPMYARMLGMPVKAVRPTIAMAGTIYQMHAALNNAGSLMLPADGEAPPPARAADVATRQDGIRAQLAQIVARGGYERPAYISYKRLIADIAGGDGESGHFGAERGTNRFAACDALIVVGAPQPRVDDLIDAAAMLFDERVAAFNTTWSERHIPYAGQPYAWPIGGFWDDDDLQLLVEQTREAELKQAIHRARPLRRDVDVWLLTNAPLPDIPVSLVSLRELFEAPPGIDPYRWPAARDWARQHLDQHGIITTLDVAAALDVVLATARRYLRHLIDQEGYEICPAPERGRGKPTLAARRRPCT